MKQELWLGLSRLHKLREVAARFEDHIEKPARWPDYFGRLVAPIYDQLQAECYIINAILIIGYSRKIRNE